MTAPEGKAWSCRHGDTDVDIGDLSDLALHLAACHGVEVERYPDGGPVIHPPAHVVGDDQNWWDWFTPA